MRTKKETIKKCFEYGILQVGYTVTAQNNSCNFVSVIFNPYNTKLTKSELEEFGFNKEDYGVNLLETFRINFDISNWEKSKEIDTLLNGEYFNRIWSAYIDCYNAQKLYNYLEKKNFKETPLTITLKHPDALDVIIDAFDHQVMFYETEKAYDDAPEEYDEYISLLKECIKQIKGE